MMRLPSKSSKLLKERKREGVTFAIQSVVIFGDLNYPGIKWSLEEDGILASANEKIFLYAIEDSLLSQCKDFPTFKNFEYSADGTCKIKECLLDFVLTSEPEMILEAIKLPILGDTVSGHSEMEVFLQNRITLYIIPFC